jgi:hypothetical protein
VTLTATDEVGLTATRTFTIAVAGRAVGGTGGTGTGGTGTGPTNHPVPPRLTGLRVSPNPVKLAQIGRLRLRFSLNERASLTVVAQRPGAHSAKQRTTVRTLARAGRGSITIGGTLKRRHVLTAGTWTLTVVATDAAGDRTKAQTLRLVVRV